MSDEQNVEAGSETSGDTAAVDTAQADTASTDTSATDTAQADAGASADAGGAAGQPKTGDSCVCPDGRPGTVHVLDEGLVCLPNQG
jgi:hypothetical protein